MIFRSIRQQLIGWFAAALTIFIIASGGVWYWRLSRTFIQHTDIELAILADDYFNHHLQGASGSEDSCKALEHLLHDNHHLLAASAIINGTVACSFGSINTIPDHIIQPTNDSEYHYYSSKTEAGALRILQSTKNNVSITFARSLDLRDNALKELLTTLAILSPLAALLIFSLGRLVADRAIDPICEITTRVKRISANNLNSRLPLSSTKDELYQLSKTFNDMIERLQDSFERTQRFSADASHELRTPLAILRGETEVALKFSKDPEEFRDVLISNLEEIERMTKIIEGLLELTKSADGQISLSTQTIDLPEFIEDLLTDTTMLAESDEKRVISSIPSTLPATITGDRGRLYQAFLNIITNAIKYTPGEGTIEFEVSGGADTFTIAIKDSGIGIAPEDLPKVFDRFYRVDSDRTDSIKGTGLGLSIVKWIIDMHRGTIDITSTLEEGTTVTVTLPITQK